MASVPFGGRYAGTFLGGLGYHGWMALRLLPVALAAVALATCTSAREPASDAANVRDAGDPDTTGDTGVPRPPFSPSNKTVREASCLAYQLPTAASGSGAARRKEDLEWIDEAGIRTVRGDFLWHLIERTRGQFDFTAYDRRVSESSRAGVEQIAILLYGNPWATSKTDDDPHYPPDDPADFARYVKKTVAHYKGKIRDFEIWNEPNVAFRFWKGAAKGDPRAFGALLKAAYRAAKQANPRARVIFGGLFYHGELISGHVEYLGDVYKAHPDIGKFYDAMALHPYAIYPPGAAPESRDGWEQPVGEMVGRVRAVMRKHGDGDKPILATEVGWPIFSRVDEKKQARYLVRAYLLLMAAGSTRICWFTLRDTTGGLAPTENTFGLLRYDAAPGDGKPPRPKLSYEAYRTLLATLGGYRIVADLTRSKPELPPAVRAFRLRDGDKNHQAFAVWSTSEIAKPIELPVGGPTRELISVNIQGERDKISVRDGRVSVRPSPDPIYLLEE